MFDDDKSKDMYAHWLAIAGSLLMILFGFLEIFSINATLSDNFIVHLLMLVSGSVIFLLEMDNEYIPKHTRLLFKSKQVKAFAYIVVAVLLIASGLPSIILIISAVLYYL